METDISYDAHINTVKELLLDEEKLITYVSLSKDLCIHVNTSKILLNRTVETIKNDQPNILLNINYIISGLTDEKKARIMVCSKEDLDLVRNSYKIIFFEHIYSVAKGVTCVKDSSTLLLNKFEDFTLCKGFIKNSECNKYEYDEINDLKHKKQDSNSIVAESHTQTLKIKLESNITDSEKEEKGLALDSHKDKKIKTLAESKIKTEFSSNNELVPKTKTTNQKMTNLKSQKGIANFFAKSSNNQKTNGIKSNGVQHKEIKVERNETEVLPVDKHEETIKTEKDKGTITKLASENTDTDVDIIKKEVNTSNTNKKIKKPSKVEKNRKRVLQVSESDSEEENDPFASKNNKDEESEDEIPPTPMTSHIKITSGLVNPKKKRKVIDKTFMDDEGYILTKKVEIYESCSDNEDDTKNVIEESSKKIIPKVEEQIVSPSKKNTKKASKKKISPPKGKQSTLMNFFKIK